MSRFSVPRMPGRRRFSPIGGGVALLLLLAGLLGGHSVQATEENRLKVALIYKLTKFVEWPADVPRVSGERFQVCLIGRGDIMDRFDAIAGREVAGRAIELFSPRALADAASCDLAFITREGLARIEGLHGVMVEHSVLSVSDERGFAANGGMVELAKRGRKLVFRVNRKVAERAGIRFSAPFLGVADLVGE